MALALPIQNPVVQPSEIRDRPHGDVPASMLEAIDDRHGSDRYWKMAHLPARAMRALHARMLEEGILLDSTGRTRSFVQQYNLFLSRHTPVSYGAYLTLPSTGGRRRYWPTAITEFHLPSVYWKLNAGVAAAAVPDYDAPHVTGCADDLAEIVGGAVIGVRDSTVQKLIPIAPSYGFRWSLTAEPWHLGWVGGDNLPAAVLAYEAGLGIHPAPVETPPPATAPSVPPGTYPQFQGDHMATARITVEGRNAQFYGTGTLMPDGNVDVILITWSGAGEDPNNHFIGDHNGSPVLVDQHYLPSTLQRDLVLIGDPSEIADSSHSWSRADFFRVS